MIERMVLFGATGDLAGRFLLPALAWLRATGHLPPGFRLVGTGREQWSDQEFRRHVEARLGEHAGDVNASNHQALLAVLRYRFVDFQDLGTVRRALRAACMDDEGDADSGTASEERDSSQPIVAYLALPTAAFPPAVSALSDLGLASGSRVALEKPFGEDLDSAKALNDQLRHLV